MSSPDGGREESPPHERLKFPSITPSPAVPIPNSPAESEEHERLQFPDFSSDDDFDNPTTDHGPEQVLPLLAVADNTMRDTDVVLQDSQSSSAPAFLFPPRRFTDVVRDEVEGTMFSTPYQSSDEMVLQHQGLLERMQRLWRQQHLRAPADDGRATVNNVAAAASASTSRFGTTAKTVVV